MDTIQRLKHPLQILLIITSMMMAQAGLAALQASIDRAVVYDGESFTLTISTDSRQREMPDLALLEKDFRILGTGSSQQVQVINGVSSVKTSWNIQLQAKASGQYHIPSLRVGKELTNPLQVTVSEPPPATAHVADIVVSRSKTGRNSVGSADVMVHDQFGLPIEGAIVTGDWLITAVVAVSGTVGVTGPDGVANDISSGPLTVKGNDALSFCVTSVEGMDLSYDADANHETCDVPGGSEEPPALGEFTLTTKVKNTGDVTLRWEGSTASLFDLWKDGVLFAQDTGSPYTHSRPGSGTHVYRVCEAGTGTCTNDSMAIIQ